MRTTRRIAVILLAVWLTLQMPCWATEATVSAEVRSYKAQIKHKDAEIRRLRALTYQLVKDAVKLKRQIKELRAKLAKPSMPGHASTLSLKTFAGVKAGMKRSEVAKLLGGNGVVEEEGELHGARRHLRRVVMYCDGKGGSARFVFRVGLDADKKLGEGTIDSKSQTGLK